MSIAANYYTERMLQEHDSLKYRPSVIAAAAVCLAINHPELREFDEIQTAKPGVVRDRCFFHVIILSALSNVMPLLFPLASSAC